MQYEQTNAIIFLLKIAVILNKSYLHWKQLMHFSYFIKKLGHSNSSQKGNSCSYGA
jgi:hypothetical protein